MIKSFKKIKIDWKIKAGYTTAFIILLGSYLLSLYGNNQLMKQTMWVNKTNSIIGNLETLVSGMKDAENGLRGFLITRDTTQLAAYHNSFAVVNKSFAALKTDSKDNKFQQKRLDSVSVLIRERYTKLAFILSSFQKNNYVIDDNLLKNIYTGKVFMDKIRSIIIVMQLHERDLLQSRNKALEDKYVALNVIIIISFIVALVFAFFGFYTYRRENKARQTADKKAADFQKELQQQIVELDKANEALKILKRSEKFASTGRVARTIAHEVRNPLTNINLAVAQIKADMPAQDTGVTMLFDIINRNSARINQLISKLLDATRFTELNYAPVLINELLDGAIEMAKDRLELNAIKVEKYYSTDICKVTVDAEKIKIAFLNVIVNAVEAMENNTGVLKIITKGENDKCVVEITDNGQGMTEEELNTIFEPYFSTKENGNGLGLTNTANIILNHKGDINVTSTPGKGTTFTIKFEFSKQDFNGKKL